MAIADKHAMAENVRLLTNLKKIEFQPRLGCYTLPEMEDWNWNRISLVLPNIGNITFRNSKLVQEWK